MGEGGSACKWAPSCAPSPVPNYTLASPCLFSKPGCSLGVFQAELTHTNAVLARKNEGSDRLLPLPEYIYQFIMRKPLARVKHNGLWRDWYFIYMFSEELELSLRVILMNLMISKWSKWRAAAKDTASGEFRNLEKWPEAIKSSSLFEAKQI